MGYNPLNLLGPQGQPFVAGEAPYTRRTILALGGSDGILAIHNTIEDFVTRQSFTLPYTPIRYRFRIRNNDLYTNTTGAGPYNLTGIYVGKPASSGLTAWNGSFASAPTSVSAATPGTPIVIDSGGTGAEYVGPWITTPLPSPNQAFAVSLGFNASSSLFNQTNGAPSQVWQSATTSGTTPSNFVGNTGAPTGGSLLLNYGCLDIRIEWEYIGNNPIGLFIGTSLLGGYTQPGNSNVPYGNVGPDECWPNMVGARTGHAITNGGVGAALTATWDGTPSSSLCYQRFLDPTYPTLVWPGGCTPDYAVIELGINDALGGVTLATFQANIATIVANLNSLGIYRIFICTVPPTVNTAGSSSGPLNTAIAATAHTSVVMAASMSANGQVVPNGGYPGLAALWPSTTGFWLGTPEMGNLNGLTSNTVPYAITSASGGQSTALTLTVPSFTPTNAYEVGDPVLGAWEGYRRLYNRWLRQHVLGTMGTLDLAIISEGRFGNEGYATALNNGTFYQGGQGRPEWYGATAGPHPQDPSMYEAWAAAVTPQLIGI